MGKAMGRSFRKRDLKLSYVLKENFLTINRLHKLLIVINNLTIKKVNFELKYL